MGEANPTMAVEVPACSILFARRNQRRALPDTEQLNLVPDTPKP